MSERILQDGFAAWLKANGVPFCRPAMHVASTIQVGWPDFTICYNGFVLFLEAKFGKNALSKHQRACHEELKAAGNPVFVIRDLAAACELVAAWKAALGPVAPVDAPRRETTIYGGKRYTITEDNQLVDPRPM